MLTVDLCHQPFTETVSALQAAATGALRWEPYCPTPARVCFGRLNPPRGAGP